MSGGFRGVDLGHTDLVWRYLVGEDQWLPLPRMLSARSYHCMEACRDHLWVFGGVKYYGDRDALDVMVPITTNHLTLSTLIYHQNYLLL